MLNVAASNVAGARGAVPYDAIYFILIDRFANGDPTNDADADRADPDAFHGGDFAGIIDHLDELQSMGIRTLWLSPFFRMRTSKFFGHAAFHGYWVEDLREVEPRFGTAADLERLSAELDRRGMKLMLDVVLNHVAPESPWVKARPTWFHGHGGLTDWNDPKQITDHDVHGLPDLAQENPEVYAYLRTAVLDWVKKLHPAGLRLDAVKHIPLSFWARFNDDIRAASASGGDLTILGEVLDGDPAVLSTFQREGHFDALFDFPLYYAMIDVFCRDASPARLAAVFSQDRAYDNPERLVTLTDNHDLPRLMTDCGGDRGRVRQALSFLLTARGTPSIAYGTEAALEGASEPENRADMRFADPPLTPDIRALLAARRNHGALLDGVPLTLEAEDHWMAYARVRDDEAVVVAVNHDGANPRAVMLPKWLSKNSRFSALLSGQPLAEDGLVVEPNAVGLFRVVASQGEAFKAKRAEAEAQWRKGTHRRSVEFVVSDLQRNSEDGGTAHVRDAWQGKDKGQGQRKRGEQGTRKGRSADVSLDGGQGMIPAGASLCVVGSGSALGAWKVPASPAVDASSSKLELPLAVGDVHEFKLAWRKGDQYGFESGPNHLVFIEEGEAPLRIELNFRP
ncbi:MAG: hypothetical protein H6729_02985 [Deltaproteobacteria bacterium]|nr:hypothetical protein [Deltaproteobacteria bacterium]